LLLEQAKKLGLELITTNSGLVVAKQQEPKQSLQPTTKAVVSQDIDDQMIDTLVVDRDRGMTSVGGEISGVSVSSHREHNLSEVRDKLPDGTLRGKVKMEIAEGRGGMPIAIPTKRIDGTGITNIKIIPTTDADLQKRFKGIADSSRHDAQPDFRNGYDVKPCPLCHGNSVVKNRGKEIDCPKCKGNGML
jgi:hypothetical protein